MPSVDQIHSLSLAVDHPSMMISLDFHFDRLLLQASLLWNSDVLDALPTFSLGLLDGVCLVCCFSCFYPNMASMRFIRPRSGLRSL